MTRLVTCPASLYQLEDKSVSQRKKSVKATMMFCSKASVFGCFLIRILVSSQRRIPRMNSSRLSPRMTRQNDLTILIIHFRGRRSRDPLVVHTWNELRTFKQQINTCLFRLSWQSLWCGSYFWPPFVSITGQYQLCWLHASFNWIKWIVVCRACPVHFKGTCCLKRSSWVGIRACLSAPWLQADCRQ